MPRAPGAQAAEDLKVLHVVSPAQWGGLERVVHGLALAQKQAGHEVSVLAVVDDAGHAFVEWLRGSGVRVEPVMPEDRGYARERRLVLDYCRQFGADIVHTHGYRSDVIDGGVARKAKAAWVTTVHGFTGGGWKNRVYERLQVYSYRQSDGIVAVSDVLRRELAAAGVPTSRLHMVRNAFPGPSPVAASAARDALGIEASEVRIGWIGRLTPEKGADVLIRALPFLTTREVGVSIVGDGSEREALKALAHQLGVHERVHWHGSISEAGRYCTAFDVFVLSSRTEGTPIVLLEAMAGRVPVVATAVGGIPAVFGNDGGLLVPPDDPEALARAIESTLHDRISSDARATTSYARLVADYGTTDWVHAYQRVYTVARQITGNR